MEKKFFDLHFHAFNISHANLTSFCNRLNIKQIELPFVGFIGGMLAALTDKDEKILNLISIMDNDIGDFFLYVDYYLRNAQNEKKLSQFTDHTKIIITPLMMDFGYNEHQKKSIFYNLPPQKPIVNQVSDLFQGIKKYYEFDIKITPLANNKVDVSYVPANKASKLLEIYPFLCINTKHFRDDAQLLSLLTKYFGEYSTQKYTPTQLYQKFYERLGTFDGNILNNNADFNFMFSGVKLYPPLDFDPWAKDAGENKKLRTLYEFCATRGIPITAHCSDSGFRVIDQKTAWDYTSPARWIAVLNEYKNLKLNLAHFGRQDNNDSAKLGNWQDQISLLIENGTYTNLYTDFACRGNEAGFYTDFADYIEKQGKNSKLPNRILFGSDFMINLLWSHSYNEYLKFFFESKRMAAYRQKFCVDNPSNFLFGGAIEQINTVKPVV